MRSIDRRFILTIAALCAVAMPARAEFYQLDGRFDCLSRPDAVCFDKSPAGDDPYERSAPSDPARPVAAVQAPLVAAVAPAPRITSRPSDPVLLIADRIKRQHPDASDLAALRRAADAGDSRAIELLAWCALNGIGTERDPMAAYSLYGKAAAASVPHARENQLLVFEHALSADQRERLLEQEAAQRPPAALLSDATGAPRHVP